ncbi:RICIN domain-containing protein [Actinospica robiniae]|uniref:RICIN domain-containing protein n=1 Tax=Actinospica robiniae TaxID=304901 RepID=UPI0004024362|nr:RICIN domain-containing protein [Actinospica robiniae]
MRLTKRRLTALVGGLLTIALTVLGLAAATTPAQASTTRNFLVTLYGWPDNSPPGNDIAYPKSDGNPTIHNAAGGTGTYANPITYATDKSELAVGTIVYYPYLHRYFIMEDDCVECDEDWTGSGPDGGPNLYHIDLWIGGQGGNSNDVINCEDDLTQDSEAAIVNPPNNEPVDTTPLFNSSTNSCYNPAGFTGGGGGGGDSGSGGPGELIGAQSGKCLDTNGGTFANNTAEQIWTCHSGPGQTWTYSGGTLNTDGGKYCLTVKGASTSRGAATILYQCNGGANQQWSIGSSGAITAPNTGFCLDVTGGATANGTVVETWTCNSAANQQWSWS